MRLIDADAFLEAMRKTEESYEKESMCPSWWTAYNVIKIQPTAYDVEAKVAELEKAESRELFDYKDRGATYMIPVMDAISIVRGKE